MEKIISLLLVLVMLLSLCACGSDNTQATDPSSSSTPTQATTDHTGETTVPTGETTGATQGATESPTTSSTEGTTVPPTEPTATNAPAADTPTHAHEYSETVTAPTCTKDGYTTYKCSCGHTYTGASTNATGHSYGALTTTKEPTASATGTAERQCSACGNKEIKTLDKLIENHTHNYSGSVTTQPSCTREGVKTYQCSCGSSYTESIAKTEHNYQSTVTAPTCTQAGYTTHKCSCGNSYADTKVNATGHKYTDSVTNPTCTAEGYTKHTCSVCGSSYTDTKTAATGHSYSVTSDTATCTAAGTKTETCGKCGNKKTSTSAAKGHGDTRTEKKDATCSDNGYTKVICNTCGTTVSNTTIPMTNQCSYVTMRLNKAAEKANNAGHWNFAQYATSSYCDYNIQICEYCSWIDETTCEFAYTQYEAAQIMLGYVNDLRAEVYGTHAYDLKLDSWHQSLAENRAVQLASDYSHSGSQSFGENIVCRLSLYEQFIAWKNSSGHYDAMIDKGFEYFGYGYYADYGVNLIPTRTYGCQTFGKS